MKKIQQLPMNYIIYVFKIQIFNQPPKTIITMPIL